MALFGQGCHRELLLSDNMAIALAFACRRARNFKLLRLIRKISVFYLACGVQVVVRWISSEHNNSDAPSRLII